MMNLSVLAWKPFKSIGFDLCVDVFTTVGKIYDLLIDTIKNSASRDYFDSLYNLADVVYVLIGIFMLFRIIVSFLNMLIDPDKVNDKQIGAGSLIKRTFISLILLIACEPSSFLFSFIGKIENAIINETIPNITAQIASSSANYSLISDVNADSAVTYECIYVKKESYVGNITECVGETCTYVTQYDFPYVIKLKVSNVSGNTIYNKKSDNNTKERGWYYNVIVSSEKDSDGNTWNYKKVSYDRAWSSQTVVNNSFAKAKCPKYINETNNKIEFKNSISASNSSYYMNVSSVNTIASTIGAELNDMALDYQGSLKYTGENSFAIEEAREKDKEGRDRVISSEALPFAQGTFRSFIDVLPAGEGDSDVEDKLDNLLMSSSANEEVYSLVSASTPKISVSYFLAIIVGIVIAIYLLLLSVEVIIRNFKLIILEVMAPIPIISYIDPKDKIFNNWLKTYATVFVELFIKLIVIKIGIELINSVLGIITSMSGLIKLLYLIAVLVFMKALPSLINKIFGIDMSSSTFKEIGKMAKGGVALASAGIGAAVGLGVGAATGKGFGRVTGALQGMARGAGSGYKKDILGGGKQIAKKNYQTNQMKEEGLNFFDRALIGAGIEFGDKKIGEQMKAANDVQSKNKALKDYTKGEIQQKGFVFNTKGTIKSKAHGGAIAGINPGDRIDMREEYNKLNDLQNITAVDWARANGKTTDEYYTVLSAQQDRVASLEDYAISEKINRELANGDQEMLRYASEFNNAVDDASNVGITGFTKIDQNTTNETISNNKKEALRQANQIETDNAKAIKRSKYMGNS